MIKEFLKEHLTQFQTAPFLFVGSGLSRRYLNLETWGGLLEKFSQKIGKDYQYYYSLSGGNFPKLASLLAKDFHEVWWNDDSFKESRDKNRELSINEESPLKIEISEYLLNIKEQLTSDETLLKEISLLQQAVIDGVITTNWDLFLENIFKDFKRYVGQNELIFSVQQGIGEIYKIHGSCSEPNSLVLTENDYKNFEERNNYLAAKLLTIFTEQPIIFIGYSLQDTNITQIIKSITACLTSSNIEKLRDRLIFLQYSSEEQGIEKNNILVDGIQIPLITIKTNTFAPIFETLAEIKRKFPAKILRQLKEHIYELVKNSEKNLDKLYVQDIDDDTDFSNLEVVFGVGAVSKMRETGYSAYERNDLFADLVFDNKNFDSKQIIEKTLPKILLGAKYVPIFKYLKSANLIDEEGNLIEFEFEIPELVKTHFEEIITKGLPYFEPTTPSYLKKKPLFESEKRNIIAYAEDSGKIEALKYFCFFNELQDSSDNLREFAEINFTLIDSERTFTRGQFQKLICLYDYLKFYKQI
jgi:hypothetical protein